jgi:hypothetical protein
MKMDRDDALDYPLLYEKALAENVRLQKLLWQEAGNRGENERLRRQVELLRDDKRAVFASCEAEIERLRDTLEQVVDDFGEGHCVCEQTKQQCIAVIRKGE